MAGYIGKGQPLVSNGAERKFKYVATAGQTVFNATYSVGSVHVYRTGVRLTDGVDYTATNGSTVTLTTGCNAGDDVVIVSTSGFQVADAFTKAELANHNLVTVDASGNVGINTNIPTVPLEVNGIARVNTYLSFNNNGYIRGDATGELRLQGGTAGTSFYNSSNSAKYMGIDSAGRVTMPYQPAFLAQAVASDTTYGNQVIPYQGVIVNRGGHYNSSTSRFTAPVAGVYQFNWSGWHSPATTGTGRLFIQVNGSYVKAAGYPSGYGIHARLGDTATDDDSLASVILELNAGDYVHIYNGDAQVRLFHAQSFSGYLIG